MYLFDELFKAVGLRPKQFANKAGIPKQYVTDYRSMPEREWKGRGIINARPPRKEMRFPDLVNLALKMGFKVVVTFERIDTPNGSIENNQTD